MKNIPSGMLILRNAPDHRLRRVNCSTGPHRFSEYFPHSMVRGKSEAEFRFSARIFYGFSFLRPKSPGKNNPTPKAFPPTHAIRRRVRHQPIPVFHPPRIPKPAGRHPTRATEGAWSLRTATDSPVPVFVAKTIPRYFSGLHADQPRFGLTPRMQYQYCIVAVCHVNMAIGILPCRAGQARLFSETISSALMRLK